MIPKFRAYDSGSLSRMYQPDEVMVGDGNIWIIDEDSVAGDWIVNNDIHLMQSTGLKDKNGKEIFEGDVLTSQNYPVKGVVEFRTDLGLWVHYLKGYSYFEYLGNVAGSKEIIGNIYENPEILEDCK